MSHTRLYTFDGQGHRDYLFDRVNTTETADYIKRECESLSSSNWWMGVACKVAHYTIVFFAGYGMGLIYETVGVALSTAIVLTANFVFFDLVRHQPQVLGEILRKILDVILIPFILLNHSAEQYFAASSHYSNQAILANDRLQDLRERLDQF